MDLIDLLDEISVKIHINDILVGSGTFFTNREEVFVITAAHVIHGEKYDREVTCESINVIHAVKGEFSCIEIISKPEFAKKDIDIIMLKIDVDCKYNSEIKICNSLNQKDASYSFKGYPIIKKGESHNFLNCTLNDKVNNKFELQGTTEQFLQLIEGSENNFNGISGSGVITTLSNTHFLTGIVLGFCNSHGEFCTFNCLNINPVFDLIDVEEESIIPIEGVFDELDKFKTSTSKKAIEEFKSNNIVEICNLDRKMDLICKNESDKNKKVDNHIECYLMGESLIRSFESSFKSIFKKHSKLLETYKRKISQTSQTAYSPEDVTKMYNKHLDEYNKMVENEFVNIHLSTANKTILTSYGFSYLLALCDLDIRYEE